jgi:hypothetical protein
VGLVRGDVFLSTSSSAAHACHFRHALALDELRVKFMPEYFHEMNCQTNDGKSKYIVTSDVEHSATPASERRESTVSDNGTNGTYLSEERRTRLLRSRKSGLPAVTQTCGYAFETSPHDTDILHVEVVGIDLESLTRPGMSRCYGCVEKRLQAVSCWSRLI